jgi:hypothetical protein
VRYHQLFLDTFEIVTDQPAVGWVAYDDANRLIDVNRIGYPWDNNWSLLSSSLLYLQIIVQTLRLCCMA